MAILITGAGGFVGRSFINSFRKYKILAVKHDQRFYVGEDEFYLELASAKHTNKLISSLSQTDIDIVFHFAAVTPFGTKNLRRNFEQDLMMAKNLKIICDELKIR